MMRTLLLGLGLLIFGLACTASQAASSATSTATMVEAKPSLDSLAWTTDMKTAQKIADKNDLRILMVFSGSDWCRPCQAFKQEVLTDQSFRDSAKDQVVILYLDFPAKKRNKLPADVTARNSALAEQYNKNGIFPTVLLLPSEGNASPCEMKYKGDGADSWIKKLSKAIEDCDA